MFYVFIVLSSVLIWVVLKIKLRHQNRRAYSKINIDDTNLNFSCRNLLVWQYNTTFLRNVEPSL